MENIASLDLIQSNHHFPGPYVFKAIGREGQGFAARVVAAVRQELDAETDPAYHVRSTPDGRHVSVTIEPVVQTGEQVLAVYRRIRGLTGLIFLW